MEFRLLGPLEVSENGRTLELRSAKERTLLAVLLLHANETISTERLIDELWGEQPPRSGARLVATYVWQLRKALGANVITTRSPGYSAVVAPEQLDSIRFERLLARAESEQPAEAALTLAEALELWRGPALADVAFESSAREDAARLDDQRLAVLAQRIDHDLALGRHEHVLAELQMLVATHPFRERYRAQLMLALYRSGRQAEALETYRQARREFVEQLGIEPGPDLQRLERLILAHDPALDTAERAGRPAAVRERSGPAQASSAKLPRPVSSFVGRERELGEILSTLEADTRLLTLTGAGGSGKTRLALEAASSLVSEYDDGVFWIGLAPLRDPSLVAETIAHALGAREGLAEHIGERRMLLLVDNLEHVIEAAPELASLLAACPNLTLLVTSRELLRVQGEVEYAVPPLAEDEAVSLFCRQTDPSAEVRVLCSRLDNLPLAVELAAARAKALTPAQILARLPQRLDLFRGGRDADPRQRTLRATIEWSYELLSPERRQLFARLAVFAGGCTLDAAEEVCAAGVETLQSLVEQSLLRFSSERYSMHETIREFAAERLEESGELDAVMERLARYLVDLANEQGAPLYLERAAEAYERLDLEHANVRAVVEWAVTRERFEPIAELVAVLHSVWTSRSDAIEITRWVEHALRARGKVADELWPHILLGAEQVLVLLAGDWARARVLMQEARELLARIDPQPFLEAMCLSELSAISHEEGRLDEARSWGERSLAFRIAHGIPTARALTDLGHIALLAGDLEQAQSLVEEARAGWRSLGLEHNVTRTTRDLAEVARRRGEHDEAVRLLNEALNGLARLGDHAAAGACLKELAVVAKERGEAEQATRLWRAGLALEQSRGAPPASIFFAQEIGDLAELPPDGREPTLDEALALAADTLR